MEGDLIACLLVVILVGCEVSGDRCLCTPVGANW